MMFRKPQIVRIKAELVWHVVRDAESGEFVGVCPPLNLNAIGETFHEFLECASEVIGLLFADLFEDGELEAFLRQNGWSLIDKLPTGGRTPSFDVPYELVGEANELVMA